VDAQLLERGVRLDEFGRSSLHKDFAFAVLLQVRPISLALECVLVYMTPATTVLLSVLTFM
jgi:hypothetical protein